MTPFMEEVEQSLRAARARRAGRAPVRTEEIAAAADRQLHVRALVEQLVSEANVVLAARDEAISLVDDTGPAALAFTLSYGGRTTRVETSVDGRRATARLWSRGDAGASRLAAASEVRALVLELIAPPPSTS